MDMLEKYILVEKSVKYFGRKNICYLSQYPMGKGDKF